MLGPGLPPRYELPKDDSELEIQLLNYLDEHPRPTYTELCQVFGVRTEADHEQIARVIGELRVARKIKDIMVYEIAEEGLACDETDTNA